MNLFAKIITLLCIGTASAFAASPNDGRKFVTLHTTSGDIVVELDTQHAPLTSKNFLDHVTAKDYDSGNFYRTVTPANETNTLAPIQVVQGGTAGDSTPNPLPFSPILLETTATTHLHHLNGTISMARVAGPANSLDQVNSATTAFFICVGDQPNLDFGAKRATDGYGFAAFGKVVSGMDVVKAIQQAPNTNQFIDQPVAITSATVNPGR